MDSDQGHTLSPDLSHPMDPEPAQPLGHVLGYNLGLDPSDTLGLNLATLWAMALK